MKVKFDHIKQSTFWNHKSKFWFFIFWGIYLENTEYKALTFAYRFNKEEGETKRQTYNRGKEYIADMLENSELRQFQNFEPDKELLGVKQVFAVAPYDVPLDEYTQKPDFDEKFSLD